MCPRVPPLGIPIDASDTVLERLVLEETGKAVLSGERSSLLGREQNGGASPGSSPINVARREIFSRYACLSLNFEMYHLFVWLECSLYFCRYL